MSIKAFHLLFRGQCLGVIWLHIYIYIYISYLNQRSIKSGKNNMNPLSFQLRGSWLTLKIVQKTFHRCEISLYLIKYTSITSACFREEEKKSTLYWSHVTVYTKLARVWTTEIMRLGDSAAMHQLQRYSISLYIHWVSEWNATVVCHICT